MDRDIQNIKTELGIPSITVVVDTDQLAAQISLDGEVAFLDALRSAIKSFLEDGDDIESPVGLVSNDPAAYNLPPSPTLAAVTERIREYMNQPNSEIILLPQNDHFLPENGESIEENWIFCLKIPEVFDSLLWAIVPRAGTEPTYNYGFS